jgi:membrane protein required for beta-lactamase induction
VEFLSLLFIIIIVVLAVLLMKILHNVIKTVLAISLLLLIISVMFGFFIVKDAHDFKETFKNEPTTYILSSNGTIITGFQALAFNFSSFEDLSMV